MRRFNTPALPDWMKPERDPTETAPARRLSKGEIERLYPTLRPPERETVTAGAKEPVKLPPMTPEKRK